MTAIVRLFSYSSLVSAPVSPVSGRLSTDSVSQLKQPYLAREKLTISSSQTSAAATAPTGTRLLMVQVQEGKTVNYEISPENADVTEADQTSPTLTGDQVFQFGSGWRIAFIENTDP
jgi:hypothetical protein